MTYLFIASVSTVVHLSIEVDRRHVGADMADIGYTVGHQLRNSQTAPLIAGDRSEDVRRRRH